MHTPWGKSQHSEQHGDGVTFYSTASHGGFHVAAKLNAAMPDTLRNADGWYEEDCEYSKVILAFPERFQKEIDGAKESFRNWFPDLYEKHFGVTLAPGESYIRDEQLFKQAHAADWVTVSAFGDWQAGVPYKMVGVVATIGGSRKPGSFDAARYFLVDAGEYDNRGRHGFVINLELHRETEDFTKLYRKDDAA